MLPTECIHGHTILKSTVITDHQDLVKLKSGIRDFESSIISDKTDGAKYVVGLDVHVSDDRMYFVHLATASRHIAVDITHYSTIHSIPTRPPGVLCSLLQHVGISFLGVGIKFCLQTLEKGFRISCRNGVDLGSLAADVRGDKRLESYGLFDLAQRVCSIKVDPRCVLGETDYGVVGAHLAFVVGNRLLGGSIPYVFKMYKGLESSSHEQQAIVEENESSQHKCIIRV